MQVEVATLRKIAMKRARREVRGAMSDTADMILATYLRQVGREFDAAVQRGELLEYVPRIATPKELLGVASELVLSPGSDG